MANPGEIALKEDFRRPGSEETARREADYEKSREHEPSFTSKKSLDAPFGKFKASGVDSKKLKIPQKDLVRSLKVGRRFQTSDITRVASTGIGELSRG